MDRYKENVANTDLYARIKLTPMSASEREVALNALRNAEAISDGIMWVVNGIKRLFTRPTLKHSFKH